MKDKIKHYSIQKLNTQFFRINNTVPLEKPALEIIARKSNYLHSTAENNLSRNRKRERDSFVISRKLLPSP